MNVKYFGMTIDTIMGRMDDTMGFISRTLSYSEMRLR